MENKTPVVWVTQEMPRFNYTSAEKFGDVKFVTATDFNNMVNSIHNRDLVDNITRTLRDFDFDRDYIAPTGSPIISMAVMAVLGRKCKKFKILKWDNRDYVYVPLTVEI